MTQTTPEVYPQPSMTPAALGHLIATLSAYVLADRAEGMKNGPLEQWRDALAVCWLRAQVAQHWGQA